MFVCLCVCVFGVWCLVLLVFGAVGVWCCWCLVLLVFGAVGVWCCWCLVLFGVCCLLFAVCCLVFGVWCLVFGVWCLVFGVVAAVAVVGTDLHAVSGHQREACRPSAEHKSKAHHDCDEQTLALCQTWAWVRAAPDPSANANTVRNTDRTRCPVSLRGEG